MKTKKKILFENLDDIVFSNRNKEYGAFYLRKKYKKHAFLAFIIAFCLVGSAIAYPIVQAYYNKGKSTTYIPIEIEQKLDSINQTGYTPPPPPKTNPEIEDVTKFKKMVIKDSADEDILIATIDQQITEVENDDAPEEIKIVDTPDEIIDNEIEPPMLAPQEPATFDGGDVNTFRTWVQSNLSYPSEAASVGISGKVFVQFIIDTKGKLVDIKISRGVHPEIDKEVVRCLMNSPQKWTPAKQGGRPVKQIFTIPVLFKLQ